MRRLLSLLLSLLFLTTTLRGAVAERPHCAAHDQAHAGMDEMSIGHAEHADGAVQPDAPAHDCPHCPATSCHTTATCGGTNVGASTQALSPFAASGRISLPPIRVACLHTRSVQPTLPPPRHA